MVNKNKGLYKLEAGSTARMTADHDKFPQKSFCHKMTR